MTAWSSLPPRSTPMRRTPMKRAGAPIQRSTRLKLVSQRQRTVEAGRRVLKLFLLDTRGARCERCGRWGPVDMHERKKRSQGGGFDPTNCTLVCRTCHEWTEAKPSEARETGWTVTSRRDPSAVAIRVHTGRWVLLAADGSYVDVTEDA